MVDRKSALSRLGNLALVLALAFGTGIATAETQPPPDASVCVPAEQTNALNSLKEAGWACVEIIPSTINLASMVMGSDLRLRSAREHWNLYQRGELWNLIAEQYGLGPESPGFFRAEWQGGVVYFKNIAGNNKARLLRPDQATYSALNMGNSVLLQAAKDALVPVRGVLHKLGAPVQFPTNQEWGQSYVSTVAWALPASRTGRALRLSEKAESSISELGTQLSQRTAALAERAKNGMDQLAENVLNGGGPPLCYAEAAAYGMGETRFCIVPKSPKPVLGPGSFTPGYGENAAIAIPYTHQLVSKRTYWAPDPEIKVATGSAEKGATFRRPPGFYGEKGSKWTDTKDTIYMSLDDQYVGPYTFSLTSKQARELFEQLEILFRKIRAARIRGAKNPEIRRTWRRKIEINGNERLTGGSERSYAQRTNLFRDQPGNIHNLEELGDLAKPGRENLVWKAESSPKVSLSASGETIQVEFDIEIASSNDGLTYQAHVFRTFPVNDLLSARSKLIAALVDAGWPIKW